MLPWWLSIKRICLQCRGHRRHGFDPWVGKIPCRSKWQPTPVFLPGKSHGQRHLVGCSLWGRKELDTTEQMSTHACNKLLQSELLKTTEIFPLTGLEIKCVKSGCWWGHTPSKGTREKSFLASSSFWWLPAVLYIPWFVATQLQSLPQHIQPSYSESPLCLQISLIKSPVTECRAHPNPI